MGRHGVVRVCNSNDSSQYGNLVLTKTIRIAVTIDAFVMVADDECNFRVVVYLRKDPLANDAVFLHLTAFIESERSGFFEESDWKANLADVVYKAGQVDEALLFL